MPFRGRRWVDRRHRRASARERMPRAPAPRQQRKRRGAGGRVSRGAERRRRAARRARRLRRHDGWRRPARSGRHPAARLLRAALGRRPRARHARPAAMPRKNRIGAHFSRLLFLIGTSTFVPDTQSGFRLLSRALVAELIDRVTWKGYESESEVLWRTWRSTGRSRPPRSPRSTLMATAEVSSMPGATRGGSRRCSPDTAVDRQHGDAGFRRVRGHSCSADEPAVRERRSGAGRRLPGGVPSRLLGPHQGAHAPGRVGLVPATFAGHLALTTMLVGTLDGARAPALVAKALAQLCGYLTTFVAVDQCCSAACHCNRRANLSRRR